MGNSIIAARISSSDPTVRAEIETHLRAANGSVTGLARALGVGTSTAYRWLRALDLLDAARTIRGEVKP